MSSKLLVIKDAELFPRMEAVRANIEAIKGKKYADDLRAIANCLVTMESLRAAILQGGRHDAHDIATFVEFMVADLLLDLSGVTREDMVSVIKASRGDSADIRQRVR